MRGFFIVAFFWIPFVFLNAQIHTVKPVKKEGSTAFIGIGAGVARSEIFLEQKIKEDTKPTGLFFQLVYGSKRTARYSFTYIHYFPKTIEGKWHNMSFNSAEINCHFTAKFENSNAEFYPLVGASYNVFSAYFTGRNDSKNVTVLYPPNSVVELKWIGLNVGTGYEYRIKKFGFMAEFKLRFSGDDLSFKNFGIRDVIVSTGIKYYLNLQPLNKYFKGTRNRYFLNSNQ